MLRFSPSLRRVVLPVACLCLLFGTAADAQQGAIRIDATMEDGAPIWQAAVDVFDSSGALIATHIPYSLATHRWEPLTEYIERARTGSLRAEEAECFGMTVPLPNYQEDVHDVSTFGEMVDNAHAIVQGTVGDAVGGFLFGRPGVMLRVEPSDWVRTYAGRGPLQELLVFYPVGQFDLGPARFCMRGSKFPPPPEPGAELLLFLQSDPVSSTDNVVRILGAGVEIVYSDSAGLHAPSALHDVPMLLRPKSISQLRRQAAKLIRDNQQ
ncbi:MAG: hypothetical protein GKS06_00055 [Acidobacteria bacterium]|nr:hypothetical protein [Acidobacteriota bacterium]